jgi:trehalose/maltose transport system substrate-binding protein
MHICRSAHDPLQKALSAVLLLCIVAGCLKPALAPVTLTFLGAWWLQPDEIPEAEREFTEFTRETEIALKRPAVPVTLFSSLDPPAQLKLLRRVLHEGGPSPDVLGIDVIWPGTLADDLLDLRPEFATELCGLDPLVQSLAKLCVAHNFPNFAIILEGSTTARNPAARPNDRWRDCRKPVPHRPAPPARLFW